ncbi:hypothetical protein GGI00_001405 [Coemansia sp. RSA 2681]|nr:hypothetical protein GGI00_001405 [Coemansia sp. RSA 2681]
MITSHNKKVTKLDIKVGNQVMLLTKLTMPLYLKNCSNSSLQHKWSGPYKILVLVGKNAY